MPRLPRRHRTTLSYMDKIQTLNRRLEVIIHRLTGRLNPFTHSVLVLLATPLDRGLIILRLWVGDLVDYNSS